MGYFTWTDARFKNPKKTKYGYANTDIINYDKYAKIVCPDNTEIEEPSYNGYGIFGKNDAYDLVADWNKNHLSEIIDKLKANDKNYWGKEIEPIIKVFEVSSSDDEVNDFIKTHADKLKDTVPFYLLSPSSEWKRTIGITIACGNNDILPYPLKITKSRKHIPYSDLYPSITCQ